MKSLSNIVSWLFLPLFTPIIGLALAMYVESFAYSDSLYMLDDTLKLQLLIRYFFFGAVVPASGIIFMKFFGGVSSLEVDNRSERAMPILFTLMSSIALYWLVHSGNYGIRFSQFLVTYPAAAAITLLVCLLLTLFWSKVSLHTAGVGMMTGFVFAYAAHQLDYSFWILVLVIILSGMVMSARIFLGKHTLKETVVGFVCATIITFVVNYFGVSYL